jgi:hypothetical protein
LDAATILFSNLVQPGNQYGPDGVGIGHTPSFSSCRRLPDLWSGVHSQGYGAVDDN